MGIFKDKYVEAATEMMLPLIHHYKPNVTKHQIEEIVESIYKQKLKDPTIVMDNNVIHDTQTITLTKLCGWIEKEKPVVSGNATFYMQPDVLLSPTSIMLNDWKLGRKAIKKQMFQYKPGSDEYNMLDLQQGNEKIKMNSDYGASGSPMSAFYTKYGPPATTAMAQSIITVMAAFFESFIGDNQVFFNSTECFEWMMKVSKKDKKIPGWVQRVTSDDVFERIRRKFYMTNPDDWDTIKTFIESLNNDQLVYLYYVNNMKEFISRHKNVQKLLEEILTKLPNYEAVTDDVPDAFKDQFKNEEDPVLAYNRWVANEMFIDPYNVPDIIKAEMDEFTKLVIQFVFVEYITPDSVVKLNNHPRNTVLLVDTDSNILNADIFVSFVTDTIFQGDTFGRQRLYNDMILVNVLANTLSEGVSRMLDYYGRMHNMDEKSRAQLTMKNEFMFRRFFVMKSKKRYAASTSLREGSIIIPFKTELKGFDFIKAGVTEEVSSRFTKMLEDHILFSDDLELHELMRDLKKFEQEIRDDLAIGGMKYLKQAQYKSENGYAKGTAMRLPVFYGSSIWNALYPTNKINSLDRVSVVKMAANNIMDIEPIKYQFPDIYQMLVDQIFTNPLFEKNGMKYLCIPNTMKVLPEWVIPLVNVDAIVSDVVSSFQSVLDALGIEEVMFKSADGKPARITSCLVSL